MVNRRFYTLSLGAITVFIIILWLKTNSERQRTVSSDIDDVPANVRGVEAESAQDSRVKVSVYYEVLCPDSINFVVNQLWPTYNSIGPILNVDLVPYGKASHNPERDTYRFDCQHGPQECNGNRIHSCALQIYPNVSQHLPFVQCSLAAPDPVSASQPCANNNGLDWRLISECSDGNHGNDLLRANGDRTHSLSPRMVFVPWILINGVYGSEQQERALNDFMTVICNSYAGEKPLECLG